MPCALFSSRRRHLQRQAAAGLVEWLDSLQRILDSCAGAIAAGKPPDSGATLDAIDRTLMRFSQCAAETQALLRRSHPQLAVQLRRCTELAYHLRNHTRTYLLRAADIVALEVHGRLPPARAQHDLDEAHQQAATFAALLRQDLDALHPELHHLIADWSNPR